MKQIGSGQSNPPFNPFGVFFSLIGFFVKFIGFFIMMTTLVSGVIMSLALFFGFKKLSGNTRKNKAKPKRLEKDFNSRQNNNARTKIIEVEAEVLEN